MNNEHKYETQRYDKADLMKAINILKDGGIILYPTDTIWGIGCDARNKEAVKRIYKIKQREDSKAMLCLLDSSAKLQGYIDDIPDMAFELIEMSEKPLTIIYDNAKNLAENLIASDGTIGIRITRDSFSKVLCEKLHAPIVSTSANISGRQAPRNFSEIDESIKKEVDYVVQYRQDDDSQTSPSHIIRLSAGNIVKVIR